MTRPYDSIPRSGGAHEKEVDSEHSGMNVRAPQPNDGGDDARPTRQVLRVTVNESKNCYRLRTGSDRVEEGFTDVCSVDPDAGIEPALEQVGEGPYFVVLENEDTGEVFYEADHNLSDNWSDGGRFDVVTLFETEEEAAAYADERRKAHQG
jgi:hypothetical protein